MQERGSIKHPFDFAIYGPGGEPSDYDEDEQGEDKGKVGLGHHAACAGRTPVANDTWLLCLQSFYACLAVMGPSLHSLHISECGKFFGSHSLRKLRVAPHLRRPTLDQCNFKILLKDFNAAMKGLRCVTSHAAHYGRRRSLHASQAAAATYVCMQPGGSPKSHDQSWLLLCVALLTQMPCPQAAGDNQHLNGSAGGIQLPGF